MFYIHFFISKNDQLAHSLFFGERCELIAQVAWKTMSEFPALPLPVCEYPTPHSFTHYSHVFKITHSPLPVCEYSHPPPSFTIHMCVYILYHTLCLVSV